KKEVYLDSENSGLIFPEALEEMILRYREVGYGHPSITHKIGWESYEALFETTSKIADFIGAEIEEIVYTHSGTESNNLAILGSARANKTDRNKIIVSSIEHLSVIFPAEELRRNGYRVIKLPVDGEGLIDPDVLATEVDKDTLLVSIASVNHEIGSIQDIKALVEVVKDKDDKVIFHTDAADGLGKIPFDVRIGVDLATFSSHKVYGPKGVGTLYIRKGVELERILYGQLSTQKMWPGAENVPAISGFGKAIEIMRANFDDYTTKMKRMRDTLIDGILSEVDHTLLNGPRGDRRGPDNVNISFLYCEGEAITVEFSMRGIYVASGSACTSRTLEPSHVMLAIGRKYEEAHGSILMKVTPMHREEDVRYVLEQAPSAIERIRTISPIKRVG
ncbi:MAG: cysteine desulfurase, partial [Candidatus Methylarchaceae archaeon HK01M]|nr:cysteine desulfurase [Candidatus Methylarchaceae archaeon HK01M]